MKLRDGLIASLLFCLPATAGPLDSGECGRHDIFVSAVKVKYSAMGTKSVTVTNEAGVKQDARVEYWYLNTEDGVTPTWVVAVALRINGLVQSSSQTCVIGVSDPGVRLWLK